MPAMLSDPPLPKPPTGQASSPECSGSQSTRRALLRTGPAQGTRHLPQITSEVFVPFTFTTSPFSSQLQGRMRPRNHSSSLSMRKVPEEELPGLGSHQSCARKRPALSLAGSGGASGQGPRPTLGPALRDGDTRYTAGPHRGVLVWSC